MPLNLEKKLILKIHPDMQWNNRGRHGGLSEKRSGCLLSQVTASQPVKKHAPQSRFAFSLVFPIIYFHLTKLGSLCISCYHGAVVFNLKVTFLVAAIGFETHLAYLEDVASLTIPDEKELMESMNHESDYEESTSDQAEGDEGDAEAVKMAAYDEVQAEHADEAHPGQTALILADYTQQDVTLDPAEPVEEMEAEMDVVLVESAQEGPRGPHDLVLSDDISNLDSRSIWRLFESTKRSAIFHIDQYLEFREISESENESEESSDLKDGKAINHHSYMDTDGW